jgi:hypothetical protein
MRGNNEQEVQQPPRNRRGARHQGQNPLEANLHDAPMINLRQKINKGCDARLVIKARRRDRIGRRHDDDDGNRYPAYTTSIIDKSYPKDFMWQNQPELHRLKCANPFSEGSKDSTALQMV